MSSIINHNGNEYGWINEKFKGAVLNTIYRNTSDPDDIILEKTLPNGSKIITPVPNVKEDRSNGGANKQGKLRKYWRDL